MSLQIESLDPVALAEGMVDCFKIVLAYQDQESAIRGVRICDKIASGLGKTFLLSKVMWKFDLLNLPRMLQLASEDAATADMIIFAMQQDVELPRSVCAWIEKGLKNNSGKPRALVVLLSGEINALASSGLDYLRELAESHKLDFFSNLEEIGVPISFSHPV